MQWSWLIFGFAYFATALVCLVVGRVVFELVTPFALKEHLGERDNVALGLVLTGYLAGVMVVITGVFSGGGEGSLNWGHFLQELPIIALYAALGMGALLLAGFINDKLILPQFSVVKELVEDRNLGVGAVLFGSYVASGLVVAGGIHGSVDLPSFAISFVLGQAGLVLYSVIYQKITPHDEVKELHENDNAAVGVAWGGHLIAFGVILMMGLSMSGVAEHTWKARLSHFGYFALLGALLLPMARLLGDRVFLPGHRLFTEIVRDKSMGAAFLEGGTAISLAVILVFCF